MNTTLTRQLYTLSALFALIGSSAAMAQGIADCTNAGLRESPTLVRESPTKRGAASSDDLATNKGARVAAPAPACDSAAIKAPRDAATGQSTGKRMHAQPPMTDSSTTPDNKPDTNNMAISEQGIPSRKGTVAVAPEGEAAKHTKSGHVTLLK